MDQNQITAAQHEIIQALNVCPAFESEAMINAELERRVAFIKRTLTSAGLKSLVLGISGGVDSTCTGLLAQRAINELRAEQNDEAYRFIAVRLPYDMQFDEEEANQALACLNADVALTINIGDSTRAMVAAVPDLNSLAPAKRDFAIGNTKARLRMVAQYTLANTYNALVLGTDHAAESLTGFFTKFGDGAADLMPLSGLVKSQVRQIAAKLGAPLHLVEKLPTADLEELDPGKPDEASYGVTYDEIDAFLHGQTIAKKSAERLIQLYRMSEHKRHLPATP